LGPISNRAYFPENLSAFASRVKRMGLHTFAKIFGLLLFEVRCRYDPFMPTMTIHQALNLALEKYNAGRLDQAEVMCRQIIVQDPNHADALHMLGLIAQRTGHHTSAVEFIGRAIGINPSAAEYRVHFGVALFSLGRLDEAIKAYQYALKLKPDFPEVYSNLGNALKMRGDLESAVQAYRQALKLRPDFSEAHNNLGVSLMEQGKFSEAIDAYQNALRLKPDYAEAYNNLGNVYTGKGEMITAREHYQKALAINPHYAKAHNNLGVIFEALGENSAAMESFQNALRLKPDYAEAYSGLGTVLMKLGRLDEAQAACRRTLELNAKYPAAYTTLAKIFQALGRPDEALAACRSALEINPNLIEAFNTMGNILAQQSRLEEAVEAYQNALRIYPDYVEALNNQGNVLKDLGKLDEALAAYRKGLQIKPDFSEVHSNVAYTILFHPDYDAKMIYQEHADWNHRHAKPLRKLIQPHTNDRNPERRLRIGYVSTDFREHVVGRNLLPLFVQHDRRSFEIISYSHVIKPDSFTEKFRGLSDRWRDISGIGDQETAQMIRRDGIDILVDLAMHMSGSRLLVFARKPAPVQATFMAYPGTTGLDAIDHRFTDPYLDPPDMSDAFYSEESVRLPDTFWCYDPLTSEPEINELPAQKAGYVTFGCLNNFCKINDGVLKLWAKTLHAVPQSRMLLLAPQSRMCQEISNKFQEQGIHPERLEFVNFQPRLNYLKVYHRIDVGLDTFPYNGHSTSLDSFWMGVPVVTLIGNTVVGRAGWSQLCNLDLKELGAQTPEEYIQIVAKLAGDLPRLAELRRTLRQRMEGSPLMDAKRFARNVEAAYRAMWRKWASGPQTM